MTSFKDRRGFVFLGTIRPDKSLPNSDAVLWFLQNVWPDVRRILGPSIDLTVVGDAEGVELPDGAANLGVHCLGTVENLEPVFNRHRVFIAPTRFSAGIPLKICTASALGLPTVASRHLAEQLEWIPEQDLLAPLTGDAKAFAEACIRLHEDETLWHRLRQGAMERVKKEFAQEPFQSTIRKTLVDLVGEWKTD
jgi:glycosyltransferase involved in cell wall biosynthesis